MHRIIAIITVGLALLAVSCANRGPRADYTRRVVKSYRAMKQGDWAFYELTRDINVGLLVTKVTDDGVVIRRKQYYQGAPVQGDFPLFFRFDEIEKNLSEGNDLWGKIETTPPVISTETVEAAGQVFNCTVYTVQYPGTPQSPGAIISTYVSDRVPLDGVVMVRRNRVIIRRLGSFGRSEEPVSIPAR